MKGTALSLSFALCASCVTHHVTHPSAQDGARFNRGDDPFMQVSSAIALCVAPHGPVETQQEWLDEAHYRIERGNSCWIAGRCRLSNSYAYDKEIAESVTRRLNALNVSMHWRAKQPVADDPAPFHLSRRLRVARFRPRGLRIRYPRSAKQRTSNG